MGSLNSGGLPFRSGVDGKGAERRLLRSPREVRTTIALVLLAGALRLLLAFRPLEFLDRLFMPDDVYYTLSVARSLAHGLGSTADGETITSGIQPLLAFLQVPWFWLSADRDLPVRATLIVLALCDTANVALLARLAGRLGGSAAGIAAAMFWAVSPIAIANSMGGLETSLALTVDLALVETWAWASSLPGGPRRIVAFAAAGGLAGLALLARIDAAFLLAPIGLLELARGNRRGFFAAIGCAALVIAPWWSYCWVHLGSPIPESGAAGRQVLTLHHHLTATKIIGRAAGTLVTAPFASWPALRDLLSHDPRLATSALAAVLGGLAIAGIALRRSLAALVLTSHALATTLFYVLALPAVWFFRRYLAPAELVETLLLGVIAGRLWDRWAGRRLCRTFLTATACALTAVAANASFSWLTATPTETRDIEYEGAKGYRDIAMETFTLLPAHAVVGALQSGALSYYRPDGVKVVNLDGVVDGAATAAGRQHRLAEYAFQRGVGYLVDWPSNIRRFDLLSAARPAYQLEVLGSTRPQGPHDHFTILKVTWLVSAQ